MVGIMNKCIFTRIKECIEDLKQKVESDSKLYGYPLLSLLFDVVDKHFEELNDNQKDIIIMRLIDSLERLSDKSIWRF